MKQCLLYFTCLIFLTHCNSSGVKNVEHTNRYRQAIEEKKQFCQQLLERHQLEASNVQLFLRAFKVEQVLEVWGSNQADLTYKHLIDYPFCAFSGQLGPKRKEGDLQIPEGVYHINRFNPKSKFYLSLGLNYPNPSDQKRSDPTRPGSDIFIHGGCATVGCIPITDDKIKELYVLSTMAQTNGQTTIPVHIFPTRLTQPKLQALSNKMPEHQGFWKELRPIYQAFEATQSIPVVKVAENGRYQIQ